MIASVHIADVGLRASLRAARSNPRPESTPGLRWAQILMAAPLRRGFFPKPTLGRAALLAFWDDDAALDRFVATDALASTLGGGWHARLEPVRAFGTWPGLDATVPRARRVDFDGPAVVLTLGRLRVSQAVRFLRTSSKAEAAVLQAPGLVWATGLGRPPYVATCSIWESTAAIAAYAFDDRTAAHPLAISADRDRPFHHQEAFIRFRPVDSAGSLQGVNALPASWFAAQSTSAPSPGNTFDTLPSK